MKKLEGQKLEEAKKIIETAQKRDQLEKKTEMSDEALSDVNGGYTETFYGSYAYGYNIVCPFCRRSNVNDFWSEIDDRQRIDIYYCTCGHAFAVDEYGYMYF